MAARINGGVAQLGEHLPCKQGVMSSNLTISTKALRSAKRKINGCDAFMREQTLIWSLSGREPVMKKPEGVLNRTSNAEWQQKLPIVP